MIVIAYNFLKSGFKPESVPEKFMNFYRSNPQCDNILG